MKVRRMYGGLNVEFEGENLINFAILDRACDECISREGGCLGCEEVEKPWNEYFQILRYDLHGNEKAEYYTDRTEALKELVRQLRRYIDVKEGNKTCLMEK